MSRSRLSRVLAVGLALAAGCRAESQDDGPAQPRVEPPANVRFSVTPLVLAEPPGRRFWVAFGDCDKDGRVDVVRRESAAITVRVASDPPRAVAVADPEATRPVTTSAMEDLDGDGIVDLVMAGIDLWFLPGVAPCQFGEPQKIGHVTNRGQAEQIQLIDLDHDGLLDVATTLFGNPEASWTLHLARGDGAFETVPTPSTPVSRQLWDGSGYNSYALFLRDLDRDGLLDLLLASDRNLGWFSWGDAAQQLGFTRDEALSAYLQTREPMGTALFDYDRDGRLDLFVSGANGQSILWRNRGPRDFVDRAGTAGVLGVQGRLNQLGTEDWSTLTLDVDFDGWNDLLVLRKSGDQVSAAPAGLHLNRHDRTFADLGPAQFGAGFFAKSMVCGDMQSTAQFSCWVMVEDAKPVLITNETPRLGRFLGLVLEGTVSGSVVPDAVVTVLEQPQPQVAVESADAPAANNHTRQILLGVGTLSEASVQVAWPSGLVTTQALATERYHRLVEPRVFAIDRRRVPADGLSEIEIVLDPGRVQAAGATVETVGAGEWVGALEPLANGRFRRLLRAPPVAGTTRLEIRIDGRLLKVQPRIRFE